MAKVSARGCYKLGRWEKVGADDLGEHKTSVVLRSDGAVLRKYQVRCAFTGRWRGGTYTT